MRFPSLPTVAKARKSIQAACLFVFCLILGAASEGGFSSLPADIFLRLDPLVGAIVPLAIRQIIPTLFPALGVILVAVFAGRIFCGWICPMGTTLDAAGGLARWKSKQRSKNDPVPRNVKYILLTVVMAAALLGANVAFWVSPIPLVTRLYALVLHPLGLLGLDGSLGLAMPLFERFAPNETLYWFPTLRSYHSAWFVGLFWLGLIALERVRPRFWCRYLCPAGALLGMVSRFAFWGRRTSASCNSCGRCAGRCPSGILHLDPAQSVGQECFTCMACEAACTHRAIRFGIIGCKPSTGKSEAKTSLSRRAFCGSLATGAVLAHVTHMEAAGHAAGNPGGTLVRPPGSVPESDFLSLCVRCGECMKACPTGGLQPAVLQAGFSGMFSPFLDPRSGPCDPECTACGAVCPSRTIQSLPLDEKRWAKIGTAVVDRKLCLAWAEDRRCMVCQETCPYGAVSVVPQPGHIAPVPVVRKDRCYGCGYCERHCPTATASIMVESDGAVRLSGPAFKDAALSMGLDLDPAGHKADPAEMTTHGDGPPPGFLE